MKIPADILAVLAAAACDGNRLVLTGQLDRKTYDAVNKVLVAAGGTWSRSAKAHVFDGDAAEVMEQIILTGEVISAKQEFGAFFTPATVADKVIRLAGLKRGMTVLEPSAGNGALSSRAHLKGCVVDCVEILPRHVRLLASTPYNAVVENDFLCLSPQPIYDRVVMNPPFSKQADIAHVVHAMNFLKPGGKLVAVMSASITFRMDKKTRMFRMLIGSNGGEVIPLPDGSFKEAGTGVNTVIVVMTRANVKAEAA